MNARQIFVQDVTLRDGLHAVRHRIGLDDVRRVVAALDAAGVDAIEVAHGDGLAGSSVNYGPGSHTDWEWIEAAADVLERAETAGVPATRLGLAGGDRLVVKELVDVALADAVGTYRARLPEALGGGTLN